MAKVWSYTKNDARKILREHFRELKKYKNDVDLSKSGQNYCFGTAKNASECIQQIQKRANDIMQGRNIQSQTNIMSTWVVSLPKELPKKYTEDFFQTTYMFMQDRYGKENIIAGFIHMDETQPHIHVCFVPESTSRKTGRQTVSSASLLTRAELHTCQADLEAHCRKRYGIKNLILNGKTKGGVSLEELKKKTAEQDAKKQLEQLQQQITAENNTLSALQQRNNMLRAENDRLKSENEYLKEQISTDYKKMQSMTDDDILKAALQIQKKRKLDHDRQEQRIKQSDEIITPVIKRGKRAGKVSPAELDNSF